MVLLKSREEESGRRVVVGENKRDGVILHAILLPSD